MFFVVCFVVVLFFFFGLFGLVVGGGAALIVALSDVDQLRQEVVQTKEKVCSFKRGGGNTAQGWEVWGVSKALWLNLVCVFVRVCVCLCVFVCLCARF